MRYGFYARHACRRASHTKSSDGILQDAHVEEIIAIAGLIMIGHAAFHAAVEQFPRSRLTLRQGAHVILIPRMNGVDALPSGKLLIGI
jgi:hypothetical protein